MRDTLRRCAGHAALAASLVATGSVLAPLAEGAGKAARPASAGLARATAGEGLMLASLGGLRTLTADAFWLRAYIQWEKQDRAACTTYANLAAMLAPETAAFREGYCNWLAFDMPHWAIREAGGRPRLDRAGEDRIHRRHAEEALRRLAAEAAAAPEDPRYPLLIAEIHDIKLKEAGTAAEYYRRAAECPSAPWLPAWRHAEKLAAAGRFDDAAAFMRRYASRVPPGSARQADALSHVAMLEAEAARRTPSARR